MPNSSYPKWLTPLFFAVYLLVGLLVFDDYGISWDEHLERNHGKVSLDYANEKWGYPFGEERFSDKYELLSYRDRDHGHTFSIVSFLIERGLNLTDTRAQYLMRHLLTFLLFWWSSIYFFKMAGFHFKNKWLALLLTTFLILSPRIFAHSFYNAKDLIFLPLFIFSSYFLIQFLDRMTWKSAIPFAFCTALLISMRVLGIIIPALTIGFLFLSWIIPNWRLSSFRKSIIPLAVYLIAMLLFTIAVWPFLWEAPFTNFAYAFKSLSQYNWGGDVLYFKTFIKATEIPWHYTLGWITISTPLLYTLLFLVGFFLLLFRLPKSVFWRKQYPKDLETEHRRLVFWSLFTAPMLAVIVFKSTLYDAWRQMFFVYPAFLILAGEGLVYLTNLPVLASTQAGVIHKKWSESKLINRIGQVVIALSIGSTLLFMIRNHPYQNVYFSMVAGTSLDLRFEQDYWGLANKQVLEQLLEKDTRDTIKIRASNWAASANKDILPFEQRKRLQYVSYEKADYYISNHRDWRDYYRMRDQQPPFNKPFVEIKVNGNIICGAYHAEGTLPKYPN